MGSSDANDDSSEVTVNHTTIVRRPSVLRRVLRFDAAFSTLSGVALIALAGLIDSGFGLGTPWVLVALGVVFVAYGDLNLLISRPEVLSGRAVAGLIAADLIFAAVLVDVAVTNPSGADTWARWVMVASADAAATVALAKWRGLRLSRREEEVFAPFTTHAAEPA